MYMMTLSNGIIFRVTGPLCGEFTGHRWIPRTKASDAVTGEFPAQRPVTRSFDVFFDLRLHKRLSKQSWEADDLRRHRAHYDVIVINKTYSWFSKYEVSYYMLKSEWHRMMRTCFHVIV